MQLEKKLYFGLTVCSLFAVTACSGSGVKETLGIGSRAPDEFRVVSRPPLSVPPQFNLRPPSAEAQSPTIVPADRQAHSIVTGTSLQTNTDSDIGYDNSVDTAVAPVEFTSTDSKPAAGDGKTGGNRKSQVTTSNSVFLSKIGVDRADPKVRDELVQQKLEAQEKKEEGSWWNRFDSTTEKKDPLVNAEAESKRIKTNQAANKPMTEGKTPEVKDKDRGLLGNIFGW